MTKKEIDEAIKKEVKDAKKEEPAQDNKPTKETELQKKIDDLTDTLKRVQADYENYKKRVDRDKGEFTRFAESAFIAKLLPIMDNLEIAIKNKDKQQEFIKAVELIYADLFSMLEKDGLKPIEAEGKKFDPCFHEALISEKTGKDENIVLEELQKGYTFRGCVIRTSKVKVSKK